MRSRRAMAGALALLAALGCAGERPRDVPARPQLVEGESGAALPSGAAAALSSASVAIDLPTVLALAGEKPNAVRFARERLAEADAEAQRSGAALLPSLTVGGNFQRHNGTIQDISGKFFDTTRQRFFLGGTGELLLETGAGLAWLRDRQRRDVAALELSSVQEERVESAALAYFELVGTEASLAIARESLEHARAFREVAASRERHAVGLALDRLRADAEVARARQAEIGAEESFRVASIRLATLLRLDAQVSLRASEREVRPVTLVARDTPPEKLVAMALEGHPDVRAAAGRVRAADLDEDAARIGPFLPAVRAGLGGLNGGLGYDGPRLTSLNGREDYYVGLELRLTGLGFGEVARARAASARLRGERVREEDVRERVVREVLEAREAVRSRGAAIDVARDELKAAAEARTIAQLRLEQGTGLAIDVLAAQEERTRAATHLVQAITGYNAAQYRLLARLGERP